MRCWRVSCETVCPRCCSVLCYWCSLHFNPGTDCLKSDSSAMPITPSPPQTQIKRFCFGGRNDLFPGAVKTNTTKMKMDSRWSQFITHYINETKSLNSHVKIQKVKKVEVKEEEQHHQPSVDAPHDYECVSIVWHTHYMMKEVMDLTHLQLTGSPQPAWLHSHTHLALPWPVKWCSRGSRSATAPTGFWEPHWRV